MGVIWTRVMPAVHLQLVVDSSSCKSPLVHRLNRAVAQSGWSLRSKTHTPSLSIQVLTCCTEKQSEKTKTKQKKLPCAEESSHSKNVMNAACFSSSEKKNGDEKKVGKSWFSGKTGTVGKKREISCKRTSWAVFLFNSLVCLCHVYMYCQSAL